MLVKSLNLLPESTSQN